MSSMLGFGLIPVFLLLLLVPLAIACFAFWIWMLVDAAQKEQDTSKIAWVLIVILLHFLGALVYFFVRKLPRKNTA